jgi:hypothetical protein
LDVAAIDLASAAKSNVVADAYDLFIYFYCVGSIVANPTIAAIDQLLEATSNVAADEYDIFKKNLNFVGSITATFICRRY